MSLYNCKCDGDQYRISKFTNDLDVEASYLTSNEECDCPAGHRPVCRHRIMLVRFIAKNATAGQWFHNYEHNQWIRATSDDEIITEEDIAEMADGLEKDEHLASAASELIAPSHTDLMVSPEGMDAYFEANPPPINLLELAKPISGSMPELPAHKFTGFEPKPLRRL